MKKIFAIIILGAISLGACTEEKEVTPATLSDKLTGGETKSWKIDKIVFDNYDSTIVDDEDYITTLIANACDRDDVIKFSKDGKIVEVLSGNEACPGDTDIRGTWEINQINGTIRFLGTGSTFPYSSGANNNLIYRLLKFEEDEIIYYAPLVPATYLTSDKIVFYIKPI